MTKLKNIKHIIDKYKHLNISTIIDLANSGELILHRTCIEIKNIEANDLFFSKAVAQNELEFYEKHENLFINLLAKIYDTNSMICYKYDEWTDKVDFPLEFYEFDSKYEFIDVCRLGLREEEFWGILIDSIGLILTMNFDLSIVLFYYEKNQKIENIEAMFDNEHFLITRY